MTHKLGNVNPCGVATIYEGERPVALVLDTPNARAHGFRLHPNATHAMCYTPGWAPERVGRHDWHGTTLTDEQARYVRY